MTRKRRRVKKRVCAIPRAPDGSAFFNCGTCGATVAISLADMHYCESNKIEFKRFFGYVVKRTFPENNQQFFKNQPISPYRLFMESFMKSQDMENYDIEIDRIGFEKWKNMSEEEKQPFVSRARELDNKHQEALKQEADDIIKAQSVVGEILNLCPDAESCMQLPREEIQETGNMVRNSATPFM